MNRESEACVMCSDPIEPGEKITPVYHAREEEPYGVICSCCWKEFIN
ncbi:hypothetical protein [Aneurinibacillus thermoaerophilus]|nr:hypothetical protein [Aneurinibacillus thermoaerophilus]